MYAKIYNTVIELTPLFTFFDLLDLRLKVNKFILFLF